MEYLYYISVFLVLYVLTQRIIHKIQNLPPSPFPAIPIIGHLYLTKKPLHRSLTQLSDKHGPLLYLWFGSRPVLVVSSKSAAEECFTKNDVIFANRPHLLVGKYFGYNYSSIAWGSYGDKWRNFRRISSIELLSTHRLNMLSHIRVDEVRELINHVSRIVNEDPGRVIELELRSVFIKFIFNVMTRMICGKRFYDWNNASESIEAKRFEDLVKETGRIVGQEAMSDFVPLIRRFAWKGVEKRYAELHRKRDQFIQDLIDGFRQTGSDNSSSGGKDKSLIQILLSLQEEEPENYTDETIRSLMNSLLHAGTNTSVETLEWAMSLLLNNPEILKKAQYEIEKRVGQDRLINESDVSELPYLQNIIKETLRMHPAAPLLLPHESSENCTVGGYHIPRGTMLLVNLCAIQNNPEVWEEPQLFRPERFEVGAEKDGFKLMPFGTGRRACPGEGLALRVVGLTLGSIIQSFDWERVSDELVDMTESSGVTTPKAQPLIAKCSPRTSHNASKIK
jgi:cytochrome P450